MSIGPYLININQSVNQYPFICLSLRPSHEWIACNSIYADRAMLSPVRLSFCESVHPSVTLVEWLMLISHIVDITFTACRQHVNIATTIVICGFTTADSLKPCRITIFSARYHIRRARYAMLSPVHPSIRLSVSHTESCPNRSVYSYCPVVGLPNFNMAKCH